MNINEAIKRIVADKIPVQVVAGKVVSTDMEAMTCEVAVQGRPTRYDVRLRAITDTDTGMVAVPAIGSMVLVAMVENMPQNSFVVATSELERVQVKIQDCYAEVSAQGMVYKRGSESLKKILADILSAIQSLTVTTPAGPSGVPVNLMEFASINTRLSDLLAE